MRFVKWRLSARRRIASFPYGFCCLWTPCVLVHSWLGLSNGKPGGTLNNLFCETCSAKPVLRNLFCDSTPPLATPMAVWSSPRIRLAHNRVLPKAYPSEKSGQSQKNIALIWDFRGSHGGGGGRVFGGQGGSPLTPRFQFNKFKFPVGVARPG
jgi:hypothetical protein